MSTAAAIGDTIEPSVLIMYAYYEKSAVYLENLKFYLKHGAPAATHNLIIINGACSLDDADIAAPNVCVVRRENTGYDFGAWGAGLREMGGKLNVFSHIVFINASCRGPFMPTYIPAEFKWWRAFTNLLTDEVWLVGPTINPLLIGGAFFPSIQTYAFAMERHVLDKLRRGFFDIEYSVFNDVIYKQEVALSTAVLAAGHNISCFVAGLRGLEYRGLSSDPNPAAACYAGDIVFPGPVAFGRQLHPYEVMFIKMNRGIEAPALSLCTTL